MYELRTRNYQIKQVSVGKMKEHNELIKFAFCVWIGLHLNGNN